MKRFAILGYPLGHALSPKLHRLLAEQLGEQIEYSICAIPPEESNNFCHRMVLHGRALCMARSPLCSECPLQPLCDFGKGQ